jgi:hypothetical protein
MGQGQLTSPTRRSPSTHRFPPRICHRKGCGRVFSPQSWNQRYCQDPECLRLLHRWQAAKRQRRRRSQPQHRQAHAAAERQRRTQRREQGHGVAKPSGSASAPPSQWPKSRAWSRSSDIPEDFCDRPGCYESLRGPRRGPAQYCGDGCSQAQRRVQDRERKFKNRHRKAAQRRSPGHPKPPRSARRETSCGAGVRG